MERVLVGVIGVSVVAFGIFLACCVDPEESSFLGRLAHWVTETLPAGLIAFAKLLRVWWIFSGIARAANYFVNERHPVVQILYVILVFGGYGAFVLKGYPLLPNPYFAAYHKDIGAVLFLLCVITFVLTSFTDPGTITQANVAGYQEIFPYDGFMFHEKPCQTCGVSKVARSKHCRYLKACVAKYDHYCIWMNNTVGYRNYRWFLAYLVCNSILMIYGVVAGATIFMTEITEKQLFEATFVNAVTNERIPASNTIILNYFMHHFLEIVFVTILCAVMGTVVTGFTIYNLSLAMIGMTANEVGKWREYQEYFEGATRQYKRIVAAREAGSPLPPPPQVVACATGTCAHPQHVGNKGKAAPKEWDPAEPKPAPQNIYTRGWLRNLAEVAWPRAARVKSERGAAGDGPLSSPSRSRKGGKRE